MGLESLPSVIFLLLPGFLTWGIFCWGTVTRKTSQIQHIFISLLLSVLTFVIAYPLVNLFKLFAINTFATSWDTTIFPGFMQILSKPETLSLELLIGIYLIAILIGFILIKMYKTGSLKKLLDSIGLDLYGLEGVWYRVFHRPDFITVYLKDGTIVSGWPERFSQTGDKETSELYLSKLQYYNSETKRWIKASKSVKGLLLNTDSISHIEFRKTEGISDNKTSGNLKADSKNITKYICNPVSQGTLYFSFALSLWASDQVNEPQIRGIAIFLTIISFFFFIAVFSERVLKLAHTILKILAPLTFLGFAYGFIIGWLQTFSHVSGTVSQVIVYFGFAWIVTILLTEVKDIPSKPARITISLIVMIILLSVAVARFINHDFIAGGILILIAILIMLVATNCLKIHGSIFE